MGYGLLEILWRGYTHWSMLCAGGISFLGLSFISEKAKHLNRIIKALSGGLLITSVELTFGVIFNLILKKNVWDYSKLPLNFKGQICFLYSLFWVALSYFAMPLINRLNKILKKKFG